MGIVLSRVRENINKQNFLQVCLLEEHHGNIWAIGSFLKFTVLWFLRFTLELALPLALGAALGAGLGR